MSVPPFIAALGKKSDVLLQTLIAWANQNSGSDHPAGLDAMHALLSKAFASLGQVETLETEGCGRMLRVRLRPDAPVQILFSGHYDTVYGANHPFQLCTRRDTNILNGPGVADMKGGLMIMLAALQSFAESPQANKIGGEVLLSPDEETGSVASKAILEAAAKRHRFGLVFEPGRENGNLVRARMGTGIFVLKCRGRAAHAGRGAHLGRNAIVALASILPAVDALTQHLAGVMVNVGRVVGGTASNVVPDYAEAEVNIRIARKEDASAVVARLNELIAPINARDGFSISVEGEFNRLPKEITPADEALFLAWKKCASDLSVALDWHDVAGGSDGNLFSTIGLPTLDGLGPVGGDLHSADEYIRIDSLVPRAQIAALFLHRVASGEIVIG
jgi:glutamate carboxypeptidase